MIVFTLTDFDELRIVKADTTEQGIEKTGGDCRIKLFGTMPEELYKNVIDEKLVAYVHIQPIE